jgi:hypothetical protein
MRELLKSGTAVIADDWRGKVLSDTGSIVACAVDGGGFVTIPASAAHVVAGRALIGKALPVTCGRSERRECGMKNPRECTAHGETAILARDWAVAGRWH